jgi:hypothetical protein
MNVTSPRAADQSAPPAVCDRIVFYAAKTPDARLRQQPMRSGQPIPARYTDAHGLDWVLLSVVRVRDGETAEQAIARETAELDALVQEIEAEARQGGA